MPPHLCRRWGMCEIDWGDFDISCIWPEQYPSSLQTREDCTYNFSTYIPFSSCLLIQLLTLRILQKTPDGAQVTSIGYIIQQDGSVMTFVIQMVAFIARNGMYTYCNTQSPSP